MSKRRITAFDAAEAGIRPAADELGAAFFRFERLDDERETVILHDVFEEVPTK